MSMETMYIYQKENAQFKEETKKLLRKPQVQQWMKLQEKEWESKLLV